MPLNFKQDILFVFPSEEGNFIYHLGAGYILAYLKQRGITGSLFISDDPLSISDLMNRIADINPQVVGLTCFNSNYYLVKLIAQNLKSNFPGILVIAGGPSATFSDLTVMDDCPQIDLCVRAEGEETIFRFLNLLKNKAGVLSSIAGITFRDNGKIIRNKDREFLGVNGKTGLDVFPSPFIDKIIDPALMLKVNKEVSFLTSRGCTCRCTYCNFSSMSRYTIRYHSIERTISELKVIKNSGVDWVSIQDDTFTLNRQHSRSLCEAIINEKLGLNFWLLTRSDTLDKEFLGLLYQAGVRHLNFGLESASPRVLYNIKKARPVHSGISGYLPEKKFISHLKEIVGISKDMGFRVGVSIILGLPGENIKAGLKTIKLVRELKVDTYAHNFLSIFPGTELFRTYRRYGLKLPLPKHNQIFNDPTVSPPIHGYNINKIPRLENEMQIRHKAKLSFLRLPGVLTGCYSRSKRHLYPLELIYTGDKFFAEWARKNTAFNTATVYGVNLESLFKDGDARIKIIIEKMSFHNRYLFMPPNKLEPLRPREAKMVFMVKSLNSIDFKIGKRYNKTIYKINLRNKSIKLLGSKRLSSEGYVLDLCRWGKSCPALENRRLIINEDGNIFTCFSRESVGNINRVDLCGVKRKIRKLYLEAWKQRKCAQCKVKDNCSKCLFLDGMTAGEYCRLRKNTPGISDISEGIFMAKKLAVSIG